jgi:hypothetical protein
VRFAAITIYVASQRAFFVAVVYFVIDSVRKLLDTPSYIRGSSGIQPHDPWVEGHSGVGLRGH